MLQVIDSHELAEWMAYEKATGPIDSRWRDVALMAICEQLRTANNLTMVKAIGEDADVDERRLPKPEEFFRDLDEQGKVLDGDFEDDEDDEEDSYDPDEENEW